MAEAKQLAEKVDKQTKVIEESIEIRDETDSHGRSCHGVVQDREPSKSSQGNRQCKRGNLKPCRTSEGSDRARIRRESVDSCY
eukprot:3415705-Amphidinium_carterae.1